MHFQDSAACYCSVDELQAGKSCIYWAVKQRVVGGKRKFTVLESSIQTGAQNSQLEDLTLAWVCWEHHFLILHTSLKRAKTTAIRWATGVEPPSKEGTLLGPFLSLPRLYKHIEIHTTEGSGQQVQLLQLHRCRHTTDSSVPLSLSLQAIPARTPLQWGGNWTDHTLFTHYAVKMKWVVPKHTVTDPRREEEPLPSMTHLLICANLGPSGSGFRSISV